MLFKCPARSRLIPGSVNNYLLSHKQRYYQLPNSTYTLLNMQLTGSEETSLNFLNL